MDSIERRLGSKVIKSLYFRISNEDTGPNGTHGTPFSLPVPLCTVSGFFARYDGTYIDSWGIIVSPKIEN